MRVATRFDHATGCVYGVEAMLGVGRECSVKERKLAAGHIIARLAGRALKYTASHIAIELKVAVVRRARPGTSTLMPVPSVTIHALASGFFQWSVDRRE